MHKEPELQEILNVYTKKLIKQRAEQEAISINQYISLFFETMEQLNLSNEFHEDITHRLIELNRSKISG